MVRDPVGRKNSVRRLCGQLVDMVQAAELNTVFSRWGGLRDRQTRSSVLTARRDTASIRDCGHSKPTRRTAYSLIPIRFEGIGPALLREWECRRSESETLSRRLQREFFCRHIRR